MNWLLGWWENLRMRGGKAKPSPFSRMDINRYGFSPAVSSKVQETCDIIASGDIVKAEKLIAGTALALLDQIESSEITAKAADEYFTLLDICLDDYFSGIELSKGVQTIISEGNLFHDYGTPFGIDIELFRSEALTIMEK